MDVSSKAMSGTRNNNCKTNAQQDSRGDNSCESQSAASWESGEKPTGVLAQTAGRQGLYHQPSISAIVRHDRTLEQRSREQAWMSLSLAGKQGPSPFDSSAHGNSKPFTGFAQNNNSSNYYDSRLQMDEEHRFLLANNSHNNTSELFPPKRDHPNASATRTGGHKPGGATTTTTSDSSGCSFPPHPQQQQKNPMRGVGAAISQQQELADWTERRRRLARIATSSRQPESISQAFLSPEQKGSKFIDGKSDDDVSFAPMLYNVQRRLEDNQRRLQLLQQLGDRSDQHDLLRSYGGREMMIKPENNPRGRKKGTREELETQYLIVQDQLRSLFAARRREDTSLLSRASIRRQLEEESASMVRRLDTTSATSIGENRPGRFPLGMDADPSRLSTRNLEEARRQVFLLRQQAEELELQVALANAREVGSIQRNAILDRKELTSRVDAPSNDTRNSRRKESASFDRTHQGNNPTTASLEASLLSPPTATNEKSNTFSSPEQQQPGDHRTGRPYRCIPMANENDTYYLSDYQKSIRSCMEFFEIDASEDHGGPKYRNLVSHQIGIRCLFCKHRPKELRGKGATCFPTSISGIYQAAQNLTRLHFKSGECCDIPKERRDKIIEEKSKSQRRAGGMQYWMASSVSIGLYETGGKVFWRSSAENGESKVDS